MNNNQDSKNQVNINGSGNTIGGVSQGDHSRVDARVTISQAQPTSSSDTALKQLVDTLQKHIESIRDETDRQMAQAAADGLKTELQKGENADEGVLKKRLDNIRHLITDSFEVVVATIANPASGFALIAQKVAAKASQQTQ